MRLMGSIPAEIGAINKLTYLNLSHNNLTGELPSTIGNLTQLVMLDVSSNSIDGEIPHEFINLKKLVLLNLTQNSFNGSIPSEIGYISSLKFLDISNNNLHGPIPSGLMNHCPYLKLNNNFLNGSVPTRITDLSSLDLSYNNFTSNYPEKTASYMLRILSAFMLGVFVACGVFYIVMLLYAAEDLKDAERRSKSEERRRNNADFSIWNYDGKVTYEDIIEATNDFDIKYCIGTGAYGSVYKTQLPNGKIVAVKKLYRMESENPSFDKSFGNEVKMLTEICHWNILRLYGFCLHKRNMFLVYEYMEGGSLSFVLANMMEKLSN
ncbi:hypothetical protein L6164_013168 [Bauhinia variegata]|uniref:Uncharacterized protein n=1 Tax=Bauhinia variegata TaxID=167791 RepID=A0ACB9PCK7_BAUVA|nr:hypothetical protein L6164_013168 [Bauhinia variegata]